MPQQCAGHSILLCNNNKWIGNGDFDIFYISHNNDNGGNESICTHLANSCNGIRPEDLLVGKVIIDNGMLLARMMRLLHQNLLCNGPTLSQAQQKWQWHH
jgi:hypothetical protein